MQRPSAAARRFYNAFYQWTLLTSPRPHLTSSNARHWARAPRSFHGTGVTYEDKTVVRHAGGSGRSDAAHIRLDYLNRGEESAKHQQPPPPRRRKSSSRAQWVEKPTQSTTERPFAGMKAWQASVRFRSEAMAVLELALPEPQLQTMQEINGKQLEKISSSSGAKLKLGKCQVLDGNATEQTLRPLLVSGSVEEVSHALRVINSYKTVSSGKWTDVPIQSHLSLPSSAIAPWKQAVRHRSGDSITIEINVPEEHSVYITESMLNGLTEKGSGAGVEVGEPFSRLQTPAKQDESGTTSEPEIMRSILLSGTVQQVQYARDILFSCRGQLQGAMPESGTSSGAHSTLPALRTHWMTVRVPDLGKAGALVIGKQSETLRSIKSQTGCDLRAPVNQNGVFKLKGTETATNAARTMMQVVVNHARSDAGLERVDLEVVGSGELSPSGKASISPVEEDAEPVEQDVQQLSDSVRATLRTLTHPVVLLTSRMLVPEAEDGAGGLDACRGVTVSSFNAVTLDPKPIVSFNLKVPSRSWDAIRTSGRVHIHVLSASDNGAAIAHAFTQPHEDPSEPFKTLMRMGAFVRYHKRLRKPPVVAHKDAVIADFRARIQHGREVTVGDHVVVFAEVFRTRVYGMPDGEGAEKTTADLGERIGLAYGQRRYRGIGQAIETPELPALERAGRADQAAVTTPTLIEQKGKAREAPEPAARAGESTPIAAESWEILKPAETENIMPDDESDMSGAAAEKEEYSDRSYEYFEAVEALEDDEAVQRDEIEQLFETAINEGEPQASEETRQSPSPAQGHTQRGTGRRHVSFTQPRPTTSSFATQRSTAKHSSPYAWGVEPEKQAYSTLAHCSTRPYSTASSALSDQPDEGIRSFSDAVTDPRLLRTTVGDFLGNSTEHGSIKALLRAKKDAEQASRRLQAALQDGTLTEEESARLENVITHSERRVAKKLALRSARDLRDLLDRGDVNVERLGWLESTIEKGQAVLLDEAKQVRQMVEDGKIDHAQFTLIKRALESDHLTLTTETSRLRQMIDEEGGDYDDYEPGAGTSEAEDSRGGFDGFRGNF